MLTRLRPSSYLEGRWEGKGTYVFYLELVTDLLHLCVYVVFFFIVFTNYGLPLHLARAARPAPALTCLCALCAPCARAAAGCMRGSWRPGWRGRRCRCMEQGIGRACSRQHRACSGLTSARADVLKVRMSQRPGPH